MSFQQCVSFSVAQLLVKSFRSIARWTTCGFLQPYLLPSTTTTEWAAQFPLQNKPVPLERRREQVGTAAFAALRCWTVLAWAVPKNLWRTRPGLRKILYGDTSRSREGVLSAGVVASSVPSYRGLGWYTWVNVSEQLRWWHRGGSYTEDQEDREA